MGRTGFIKGYPVSLFFYFDPLLSFGTLLSSGTVHKWLILSLTVVVLTLFLGRVFCGWICPLGAINDAVGKLKKRQDPLQEITAELVAQALCRMVGKRDKDTTGNSYQYIERYAEKINKPVHSAVLSVLQRAGQIIDLIMKGDRGEV